MILVGRLTSTKWAMMRIQNYFLPADTRTPPSNLAIIDEVCSPDFVFHSPKWPNWPRGIERAQKLAT
jgi:hypothetical protein